MGWMADVAMVIFQENCLKQLDAKIKEAKQEYALAPSVAKNHYSQGLEEARRIVSEQST